MSTEFDDIDPAFSSEAPVAPSPGRGRIELWLIAAGAFVLSGVAALAGSGRLSNVVGYILSAVLASSCVALFRRFSVRRGVATGVRVSRRMNVAALTLMLAAFALGIAHAWLFAVSIA